MATRSQIHVVDENGNTFKFYHHWDGYFTGVGYELAELLTSHKNSKSFMDALETVGGYERTENNHWDIEYFYKIDFFSNDFNGWELISLSACDNRWKDSLTPYLNELSKIDLLSYFEEFAVKNTRYEVREIHDRSYGLHYAVVDVLTGKIPAAFMKSEDAKKYIERLVKS